MKWLAIFLNLQTAAILNAEISQLLEIMKLKVLFLSKLTKVLTRSLRAMGTRASSHQHWQGKFLTSEVVS